MGQQDQLGSGNETLNLQFPQLKVRIYPALPGTLQRWCQEMERGFESATSQMVQRQQRSVGEPSEREHYSLYC